MTEVFSAPLSRRARTSVIVLHCRGIGDTRRCILSLLRDRADSCEIIVFDNGSVTGDAAELQKEFGDSVLIIRSEINRGYAGGNNLASRLASGQYLVFLNNDTEVTPGWLAPILEYMDRCPQVAACQPKLKSIESPEHFDYSGACGGYLDALGYPYLRGRLFAHTEADTGQYDAPTEVDWACGACMVIRGDLFRSAGGFDEKFFAYMEEVDLCLQLRKKGHRMMCIPSSVVYHRAGSTWATQPWKKCFHRHRNSLLLLVKHLPVSEMLWKLPLRLCMELAAALHYLVTGEVRSACAVLRSFGSFLFLAPAYLLSGTERRMTSPIGPSSSVVVSYYLRKQHTFTSLSSGSSQ